MLRLPLYESAKPSLSAIELATPLNRDTLEPKGHHGRACDRCVLHTGKKVRNPCIGPAVAQGDGLGGLLVVGESPSVEDDSLGSPFRDRSGGFVNNEVKRWWKGPITYDLAVRCTPGGKAHKEKPVDMCRPFLAKTVEEVQPTRILAIGSWAAYSLLGRTVSPYSSRKAYAYLRGDDPFSGPIPVFFLLPPAIAMQNRFVRQWFKDDMKHALTCDEPTFGPWEETTAMVRTAADAREAVAELATHRWVAYDVESVGKMWDPEFHITCISLCGDGDESPYTWDFDALQDPDVRGPLMALLADRKIPKLGQNVKYDQLAVRAEYGIHVRPIVGDTRLMRKILEPEADGKLAKMAELVGMGGLKQEADQVKAANMSAIKRRIKKQWHPKKPLPLKASEPLVPGLDLLPFIDGAMRAMTLADIDDTVDTYQFGLLPPDTLHRYNARDAVATARLGRWLETEIPKVAPINAVWESVVLPAANALERVEAWGVEASKVNITNFDRYCEAEETRAKQVLDQYGKDINWDSRDQVAELLFDRLKLKSVKKTDTGKDSTDAEVLEALKDVHPLPGALLEYRWVTHLRGTYAAGLYRHVRADGRIHPNIKLDGARSGRTSCTDPNLQNIPRADSDEGKMARDCFIARPGYELLELDYSQLELRVACMLSQDPVMRAIFESGVDYHTRTAQLVSKLAWGIEPDKVEKKHRSLAKTVNFGVLYGKTAGGLADEWGTTKRKAQEIVDAIMGNFKVLSQWCQARIKEATDTGEVWTWWDGKPARRRPLWRVASKDDWVASTARNGAINSPVQGTASEFCVASIAECVDWIEEDGLEDDVKLILPVHDALLFEVRRDLVPYVACTAQEIMTGFNSANVKLLVDAKRGTGWGSMVDYHIPSAKAA